MRHAPDQCAFVKSNCPDEEGLFPYLELYYCHLDHARPVAFTILALWLAFLFSTIGIAASDFLCINLSTIAAILGMSESLAGVTFLAFGNGSPDVFSTFAAMGSNSGSLAVGELVGAACFITAVVAGSMALVRPFRVARRSFVRDVGYFIIAASFVMVGLADGKLHPWECMTMIALYLFYVVMVVSWHWYLTRQRRRLESELAARAQFHIPQSQELDLQEQPEDDDPVAGESTRLLADSRGPDFAALEMAAIPAWKDDEDDETRNRYLAEIRENMHLTRPTLSRRGTMNPIRPSLVGALEFRSVLSSLQKSKNIHDPIDLRRYSGEARPPSRYSDNISVRSHPGPEAGPSAGEQENRRRSVSLNGPVGPEIRIDNRGQDASLGRPSASGPSDRQSPTHLTIPTEMFRAPNYQGSPHELSPGVAAGGVSPKSQVPAGPASPQSETSSRTTPFPLYSDAAEGPAFPTPSSPSAATSRSEDYTGEPRIVPKWMGRGSLPTASELVSTLFPTMDGWSSKSLWDKFLAVVAAPSVLILTLTVPVVEPDQPENPTGTDNRPPTVSVTASPDERNSSTVRPPRIRLPDDSPDLRPQDDNQDPRKSHSGTSETGTVDLRARADSELPAMATPLSEDSSTTSSTSAPREWHQWLVITQLFTAPLFIITIAWYNLDDTQRASNLTIPILCSLALSSLAAAALTLTLRRRRRRHHHHTSPTTPKSPPRPLRPLLALLGFAVGISWIATIADEVVSVLKTLGVILNISDGLLGLTVFAVGNSLSDLVADSTIARLGYPVMALSACFGGPMLNILLGIGLGGLYMTLHNGEGGGGGTYHIPVSKTLAISGATLLFILVSLLVIVPLNAWKMDRKVGVGLVTVWVVSTLGNVIIEIVG